MISCLSINLKSSSYSSRFKAWDFAILLNSSYRYLSLFLFDTKAKASLIILSSYRSISNSWVFLLSLALPNILLLSSSNFFYTAAIKATSFYLNSSSFLSKKVLFLVYRKVFLGLSSFWTVTRGFSTIPFVSSSINGFAPSMVILFCFSDSLVSTSFS